MSDYNLGTATGRIVVDGSAAERGFAVAQTAGNAFFSAVEDKVNSIQTLGKRMAAVGTAGVAGFGIAVKAASGFEAQMSAVEAVSGATGDQMDKVRAKALQLGKDTVFSASEAGLALEELIKAGITVEEALNGAADATVSLAAAGGVSLPEAATIASNAMNQFNLTAAEVPKVADILAGAANTSAADVSRLGQSLQQVGAVANLAGLNFEDTTIALGQLADAGIQGSDAGTSLKTMLSNLIPVTDAQQRVMDELGLSTFSSQKALMVLKQQGIEPMGKSFVDVRKAIEQYFIAQGGYEAGTSKLTNRVSKFIKEQNLLGNEFFDSEGKVKSLREVQELLNNSLKGYTKEQKLAKLETLFGADAIRASAILANQGAEGYDKFAESMRKTTAAEVAKTRMDNLKGAVEEFKGSLETAQITVGAVLLPMLTRIVQAVTKVINIFNNLPGPVQKAIAIFFAIVSVLLLVTGLFLALIPVLIAFVLQFIAMRIVGAITTMIYQFVKALILQRSVTAACAAAQNGLTRSLGVYASTLLRTRSLTAANAAGQAAMASNFRKTSIVVKVLSFAVRALGAAFLFLTSPIGLIILAIVAVIAILVLLYKKNETFRNFVNKVWAAIKAAIAATVDWFVNVAWPAMKAAFDAALDVLKAVGKFFLSVFRAIFSVVSTVVGAIATVIRTYVNIWKTIITVVLAIIMGVWKAFWNTFGGVITAVFNLIKAIVSLGMAVMRLVIYAALVVILAFWRSVWNTIKAVVRAVWGVIKAVVGAGVKAVLAVVRAVMGVVKAVWSAAWNVIKTVVKTVWTAITTVIKAAINIIKSVIRAGFNAAKAVVTSVLNAIKGASKSAWNAVPGPVKEAIEKVIGFIRDLPGKVIGFFADAGKWLYQAGVNIIQGLLNGIESMINKVTDKLNALTQKIKDAKGPEKVDKVLLYPVGRLIMQSLNDGFAAEEKRVLDNLGKLTTVIPATLEPAADAMGLLRSSVDLSQSGVPVNTPGGAAAAMAAGANTTINKKTEITINNNNPKKERTSRAVEKSLSKVNALGILDLDDDEDN